MLAEAETLGAEARVGYCDDQEITVSTRDADRWAGALAVTSVHAALVKA